MRLITSWLIVAGVLAGIAAAVVGYRAVVVGTHLRPTTAPVAAPAAAPAPVLKIRLLPCESGWVQRGQACVRVRTRVVVAPVSARPVYIASVPVQTQSSVRSTAKVSHHPARPSHAHTHPVTATPPPPVTGSPGGDGSDDQPSAGPAQHDD